MNVDKMMDKILIFLLKFIAILFCLLIIAGFFSVLFKALFLGAD